MSQGKTIQIFLPNGNARAIKIADLTSRTVRATYFSRPHAAEAFKRAELNSVGVYFLFGKNDQQEPLVYVGESENCAEWLRNHNTNKDFWKEAVVITSKTAFFTKAHVKFLECESIKRAEASSRYLLDENTQTSRKPHLSEPDEADLLDNLETAHLLLNTLGFPIFDPLDTNDNKHLLICSGRSVEATGRYEESGMVVLKDPQAALDTTKSLSKGFSAQRDNLIDKGILVKAGQCYRFAKNHTFTSPSTAAAVVLGRSSNGWTACNLGGQV